MNDESVVGSKDKFKAKVQLVLDELRSLDAEDFGEWSKPVQVISWVVLSALIVAGAYFLLVTPIKEETAGVVADRELVLQDFAKHDLDLKSALQYQEQLHALEKRFQEQLMQLPKETEISGLVEDIHKSGGLSGFKIQNITLEPESPKEVFIQQPILIEAVGDFHTFGGFVEAVSALPRIVTIQSFLIKVQSNKNSSFGGGADILDIPKIEYRINANTYRYLEPVAATPATPATGGV